MRGEGRGGWSRKETAVDESRKEMTDRVVARHQANKEVKHAYAARAAIWCS